MVLAVKWGKAAAFRTMPWNMIEAVHGMPNLGVSQAGKDVVSQSQEEDEAALPQPPKKRVRHLPPATEPVSLSPLPATLAIPLQCPENRRRDPRPSKVALHVSLPAVSVKS